MTQVRFSVFYPSGDDTTFDHDYYRDKHVPLAVEAWKPERAEIDKGVNGPYEAAVHFVFASQGALNAALGSERTGEIMADVANYTNVTPVTQTAEVVDS
jgi:uncharacterized protein (TIGR02118 family)